jgi:hypothetical protein
VKGSSTVTVDRHSHVPIVKMSPSFPVGMPISGGSNNAEDSSSARALNQALGTNAFSSGSVFATVKIQTHEV